MTEFVTSYTEATGQTRVKSVPMAHLSLEIGHLYMEDIEAGEDSITGKFAEARPWAERATEEARTALGAKARISTCYLVDDYFFPGSSPKEVIPMLLRAAARAGVKIDYLARESSCAFDGEIPVAEIVAAQIVAEPHPASNGSRPPTTVSGWLANGKRSANVAIAAMKPRQWTPPLESAANRHSIFVDVELWRDTKTGRLYSCPFLASIWQLSRLGLLRAFGEPILQPAEWLGEWPSSWQEMPGVIRLDPHAKPFSAFRTISVIPERFLPIEHAVRVILSQLATDASVAELITSQAAKEGLALRSSVLDRVGHVFLTNPWIPSAD